MNVHSFFYQSFLHKKGYFIVKSNFIKYDNDFKKLNVSNINNKPFSYFNYTFASEKISWDEGEIPWDIEFI
jgi:hypothetical protein